MQHKHKRTLACPSHRDVVLDSAIFLTGGDDSWLVSSAFLLIPVFESGDGDNDSRLNVGEGVDAVANSGVPERLLE